MLSSWLSLRVSAREFGAWGVLLGAPKPPSLNPNWELSGGSGISGVSWVETGLLLRVLSYHNKETLLFTIEAHSGTLNEDS